MELASQRDGLHGVITNLTEMDSADILTRDHGPWQVEETFRMTKHDLKIRPIYHWTSTRIRDNIAIAFMSLMKNAC